MVSTVRKLWCNLTVITGEGEVVALSHGNTNISIPSFVWKGGDGGNGTITATCRCTCQLSRGAGPTRTAALSHSIVQDKQPVVNPTQSVTMVTTKPSHNNILYVVVAVTSGIALIMVMLSVILCCHTRRMRERSRMRGCMQYRGRPLPAIPAVTECGHYNTVSLRLTDETGGCTQTFPIYHKLALSQTL